MTRVISDCLRQRAERTPSQIAFTYLLDGDTQEVQLSYGQLHQNALTIAHQLSLFTKPAERVLLLYPPGLAFVSAFFRCLHLGVTAVLGQVPGKLRGAGKIEPIVADAGIHTALTTAPAPESLRKRYPSTRWVHAIRWCTVGVQWEGTRAKANRSFLRMVTPNQIQEG